MDLLQSIRLLHRTTRKMALTQAGEVYLSRLRLILAEIDEAGDQAKQHSNARNVAAMAASDQQLPAPSVV